MERKLERKAVAETPSTADISQQQGYEGSRMGQLDKRETFLNLLGEGWVSICLDARSSGVELPEHLRVEPRLILQYGLNMPVPIADLEITGEGIRATLSFNRTPHNTFVPWPAVYVIMPTDSGKPGILFAEDVPPEMRATLTAEAAEDKLLQKAPSRRRKAGGLAKATQATPAQVAAPPERKRHLSLVPESPAAVSVEQAVPAPDEPTSPPRRHTKPRLTVVK